jgi:hypothetical protein
MKILIIALLTVSILEGQAKSPPPAKPVAPVKPIRPVATPQSAQTVTLNVSAELATALENARLNMLGPNRQPVYTDISGLVKALLNQQLKQVIRQYPPASVAGKKAALVKAQIDNENAENALTIK